MLLLIYTCKKTQLIFRKEKKHAHNDPMEIFFFFLFFPCWRSDVFHLLFCVPHAKLAWSGFWYLSHFRYSTYSIKHKCFQDPYVCGCLSLSIFFLVFVIHFCFVSAVGKQPPKTKCIMFTFRTSLKSTLFTNLEPKPRCGA